MRLFIALEFDEAAKDYLCSIQEELRQMSAKGNFTSRENLHLTLAFLGEVEENRMPSVRRAMDKTAVMPMTLSFGRVGSFGGRKEDSRRLWWVGLAENERLLACQRQLGENLREEGFSLEHRRFVPHITIGREVLLLPGKTSPKGMDGQAATVAKTICLMRSDRKDGKLVYTPLYRR